MSNVTKLQEEVNKRFYNYVKNNYQGIIILPKKINKSSYNIDLKILGCLFNYGLYTHNLLRVELCSDENLLKELDFIRNALCSYIRNVIIGEVIEEHPELKEYLKIYENSTFQYFI